MFVGAERRLENSLGVRPKLLPAIADCNDRGLNAHLAQERHVIASDAIAEKFQILGSVRPKLDADAPQLGGVFLF